LLTFVTNIFFKGFKVQSLTLFFAHVCYQWRSQEIYGVWAKNLS